MPRYGHEFELSVLTRAIVTIPMNASYPPAARTRMEHYGSFHKQDAIAGVEGQVAILRKCRREVGLGHYCLEHSGSEILEDRSRRRASE